MGEMGYKPQNNLAEARIQAQKFLAVKGLTSIGLTATRLRCFWMDSFIKVSIVLCVGHNYRLLLRKTCVSLKGRTENKTVSKLLFYSIVFLHILSCSFIFLHLSTIDTSNSHPIYNR